MLKGTIIPVARGQVLHRGANLVHHPHELVPERHSHPGIGHHPVVEVQVRTADRSGGDPDNRIVGVLDGGDIFFFDPDLVRAAVNHCSHECRLVPGWQCPGSANVQEPPRCLRSTV
jgi:hypothetical protein